MTLPFDRAKLQYEFGKRVREIRVSKALFQHELANLTGVVPHTIGNIERGVTFPALGMVISIAEALDVHPKVLLFGPEEPSPCPTISKSQ